MRDYNDHYPVENGDYMMPPIMPRWVIIVMFLVVLAALGVPCTIAVWALTGFHP